MGTSLYGVLKLLDLCNMTPVGELFQIKKESLALYKDGRPAGIFLS